MSNKVGVPNAYFMLPPPITAKPLEPREGRVWKFQKEEVSSYEHLGFHHLPTLLAWFLRWSAKCRGCTHFVLNGRDEEKKRKSFKIFRTQIVFEVAARAVDPLRFSTGPNIGREKVGLASSRQGLGLSSVLIVRDFHMLLQTMSGVSLSRPQI